MRGVRRQPGGEHLALGEASGEVRGHGIGMGQEPVVALRLCRRGWFRRCAQRGEKLPPGEVEVRAVGEVNVREGADAEGLLTLGLKQRDEPEVAIGRTEGLGHNVLDLGPFALDVLRRENDERLAAPHDGTFHFLDAGRAAGEVAEVDAGPQAGLFDAIEQFPSHPLLIAVAVRDEDVVVVRRWFRHTLADPLSVRRNIRGRFPGRPSRDQSLATPMQA